MNPGELSVLFELVTDGAKLPDVNTKNGSRRIAPSLPAITLARRGHLSKRREGRAVFSRIERPSWSLQNARALESPGLFAGPLRPDSMALIDRAILLIRCFWARVGLNRSKGRLSDCIIMQVLR